MHALLVAAVLTGWPALPERTEWPQLPPIEKVSIEKPAEKPNVQLLLFSADWCKTCGPAKDHAETLKANGWRVSVFDIDDHKDDPWVKYERKFADRSLPHWIVLVDGQPWDDEHAARNVPYLEDMLRRAENYWRVDHGLEEVPFKAYGDTADTNPVNREYFYREHWRFTPADCHMAYCTVHGAKWERVIEKVPATEATTQRTTPATSRRGCPTCR